MFTLSPEELMALSALKSCILAAPENQGGPVKMGLYLLAQSHNQEFCLTAERAVVKILKTFS